VQSHNSSTMATQPCDRSSFRNRNLLSSGSMHAERLPWSMCVPSLVMTAQMVLILECRNTDTHPY